MGKKCKTYGLRLTKLELLHLRDLFNIMLPPEMKTTVSQMLAAAEERPLIETCLWNKVVKACKEAKVTLGDDAPDFAVIPTSQPAVGVFKIASEPQEGQPQEESSEVTVFDRAETEEDD